MRLPASTHVRLRPTALLLLSAVVIAVVLVGRTEMPAAQYARAACRDLSRLVEHRSLDQEEISEALTWAAARADRAATLDKSFTGLDEDLRRIRDAVAREHSPTDAEAATADAAVGAVAERCTELGPSVATLVSGLDGVSLEDLRRQPEWSGLRHMEPSQASASSS